MFRIIAVLALLVFTAPAAADPPVFVHEVVEAGPAFGSVTAAVDAAGNVHIAYQDKVIGDLKYAVKTGNTWMIETADPSGNNVGLDACIALDQQGDPHISYYNLSLGDLRHATKSGGFWTITTVDAAG